MAVAKDKWTGADWMAASFEDKSLVVRMDLLVELAEAAREDIGTVRADETFAILRIVSHAIAQRGVANTDFGVAVEYLFRRYKRKLDGIA
jgi:hypothetical protein